METHSKPPDIYCPHCLPIQRNNHRTEYLEYIVETLLRLPIRVGSWVLRLPSIARFIERALAIFFELLAKIGVVSFESDPDETRFVNRSLIFFREAKRVQIPICAVKIAGRYSQQFRVMIENRVYYYKEIPLLIGNTPRIEIDDKFAFKRFLQKNGFPHAEGDRFLNPKRAFEYGKRLGFPLVVKPVTGSLGFHVSLNIQTEEELWKAISVARAYRPDFLVERHMLGDLYRVSVLQYREIFVCKKLRAHIVGDGISSVSELIEKKNQHPYRGLPDQQNSTLHQMRITPRVKELLASQGLVINSIPIAGRTVVLAEKSILSEGCDIVGVALQGVHPENVRLFQEMARLLNTSIVGFDVLCEDIGLSYSQQSFAVIESNSVPYVDMHQFPSEGPEFEVARIGWEGMLGMFD